MYYNLEELSVALDKATTIINNRTKDEGFQRGFSDCYAFLVEYDRVLREQTKAYFVLNFEYSNAKDFLRKLKSKGFSLKSFASFCDYEIQTKPRPKFGDIGYMNGSVMIADENWWVTTSEKGLGVTRVKQYTHFERNLSFLARPVRS
jgi:hypothetical protein